MNEVVKIEKNVPIPPPAVGRGRPKKNILVFEAMDIGDSVYFDIHYSKVTDRFYNTAKRMGMKVSFRKEGDGCRMWRVK